MNHIKSVSAFALFSGLALLIGCGGSSTYTSGILGKGSTTTNGGTTDGGTTNGTSGGSSGGTGGAPLSYPYPAFGFLIEQMLPNGALIAATTPVSPLADYGGAYTPTFTALDTSWPYLTPFAEDIDAYPSGLATVAGSNIIVGTSVVHAKLIDQQTDQFRPTYWTSATNPTRLQTAGGVSGNAASINSSGEVVGTLDGNLVKWSSVSAAPIVVGPKPSSGSPVVADDGTILVIGNVSNLTVYPANGGGPVTHAVDPQADLGTFNGAGAVGGFAYVNGSNFTQGYALYFTPTDGYAEHKLPAPSGATFADATVISPTGLIAGTVQYSNNSLGVLLWTTPTTFVELQKTLPSNYTISSPVGFLQNGSLVCIGTVSGTSSLIVVPISLMK